MKQEIAWNGLYDIIPVAKNIALIAYYWMERLELKDFLKNSCWFIVAAGTVFF